MDELVPSTEREIDAWSDTIRAEVARLFDGLEFGGVRTHVDLTDPHAVSLYRNAVTVRIDLSHPEAGGAYHAVVYSFNRGHHGELYAEHGLVRLPEAMQGRGFASGFNRHVEDWYVESGVSHIEIHASMSTGGFAWARAGFDWAPDTQHRSDAVMSRLGDQMATLRQDLATVDLYRAGDHSVDLSSLRGRYGTDDPALIADKLAREHAAGADILDRARRYPFDSPRYPRPIEVANAGWDGQHGRDSTWLGKRALLGSDWKGVKPVSDTGPLHPRAAHAPAEAVGDTVHAASVPGAEFHGRNVAPSQAHRDALIDAVTPDRFARVAEGVGDLRVTQLDTNRAGVLFRVEHGGEAFTVRVETQWLHVDAAAETTLNHDKSGPDTAASTSCSCPTSSPSSTWSGRSGTSSARSSPTGRATPPVGRRTRRTCYAAGSCPTAPRSARTTTAGCRSCASWAGSCPSYRRRRTARPPSMWSTPGCGARVSRWWSTSGCGPASRARRVGGSWSTGRWRRSTRSTRGGCSTRSGATWRA